MLKVHLSTDIDMLWGGAGWKMIGVRPYHMVCGDLVPQSTFGDPSIAVLKRCFSNKIISCTETSSLCVPFSHMPYEEIK